MSKLCPVLRAAVERTELMPQQMTPCCRGPGLVATNIDIAFMTMTWSLLNRF